MKRQKVEENIEALQWFVDYFANLNLANLKPGDKAKFFIEAKQYLWPVEEELQAFRDMEPPDTAIPAAVDTSWFAPGLPGEDSEQYWGLMRELQGGVRTVLDYFSTDVPFGWAFDTRTIVKAMWESNGRFTLSHFFVTHSHSEYVEVKLYGLLDGLPLSAVRRCPGCQKFFLNPTGRKKRFCGNRCMWRISTAERREADREGYNEYQAGLMRDRYREKNDHPRLKTKKRTTKKKEA